MSEDEENKELKEPISSILSKKSNLKSPNKRKTISLGKSVGFRDDKLIEEEEDTEKRERIKIEFRRAQSEADPEKTNKVNIELRRAQSEANS